MMGYMAPQTPSIVPMW
nr:TPA_asm: m99.5 sORF 2 [Murid betaherpesvirus 1]DBA07868.1 TPA_asm: m99.5 sORF 2 [Murid betaherpesvirus 1]